MHQGRTRTHLVNNNTKLWLLRTCSCNVSRLVRSSESKKTGTSKVRCRKATCCSMRPSSSVRRRAASVPASALQCDKKSKCCSRTPSNDTAPIGLVPEVVEGPPSRNSWIAFGVKFNVLCNIAWTRLPFESPSPKTSPTSSANCWVSWKSFPGSILDKSSRPMIPRLSRPGSSAFNRRARRNRRSSRFAIETLPCERPLAGADSFFGHSSGK
mmetsp:Transcript_19437/g.51989  ORF Transcript_19437/g.51989 Transcript_19437/m.51989 type:complete len:212 (-) Transcript_19437:2461-3096(-)